MASVSSGRSVSTNSAERRLDQRQPLGRRHRSRHVDEQDDVAAGDFARQPGAAARAPMSTSLCDGAHGQSPISVVRWRSARPPRGCGVREPEVVDELFDAHGFSRRQLSAREEAADVRVRRRVHVRAERRERPLERGVKAVRIDARVGFASLGIGVRPSVVVLVDLFTRRQTADGCGTTSSSTGAADYSGRRHRRWRRHRGRWRRRHACLSLLRHLTARRVLHFAGFRQHVFWFRKDDRKRQ